MASIGLLFAFWTYSCATLRYVVAADAVTIQWGPVAHRLPVGSIAAVEQGRAGAKASIGGVGWLGYHVGRGEVASYPDVLFFSTRRAPEELVFIETAGITYAVSPQDPARFVLAIERIRQNAAEGVPAGEPEVERELLAAHPIWSDRTAQYLALAAILLNVALWGYVFATYPDLNTEITIEFPPLGDITTLESRSEIMKIPATATAMLAVNMLVALVLQPRERAVTYLVLSGSIFFQMVFGVAAIVAVTNA